MKWQTGDPPAIGWYEASTQSPPAKGIYRWWNGHWWSSAASAYDTAEEAADSATRALHTIYTNHPPVRWRKIELGLEHGNT